MVEERYANFLNDDSTVMSSVKTLYISVIAVLVIGIGAAYGYSSAGIPESHYPPTNDTKTKLLVINSTEFKERTTGYNYTLAGVDNNWIPKSNNYYDFGGARVTFIVWGFDNGTVKGVAFNLDPQLKIKNIFEYNADNPPSGYYSDTCHGCFLGAFNSTKPIVEPKTVIVPTLKQLVNAKDAISNMMGSKMLKIPISSVGVDEQNLILDVGINDPNAVIPSIAEKYQKKVQEIVGNLPIQIDYENPVAYGEILKQNSILSPLKQLESGVIADEVKCNQGLQLIFKLENMSPTCVKPDTSKILIERGWATSIIGIPFGGHQTSANTTLPASFMECDTPYPQSNTGIAVLYMPVNSIGKICVRYSNPNDTPYPVGIRIFEANNLNQDATEISTWNDLGNNTTISKGNSTVVYVIKTGNQTGFYGLTIFCVGMPFAVGYDNNSTIVSSDFPWLGKTFACPLQSYQFHIDSLTGIGVKYIP